MTRRASLVLALLALAAAPSASRAQGPVAVDGGELDKRKDLLNREVVVDDRVRMFFPTPGKGITDIFLKRSKVPIVLPPDLRYDHTPIGQSIRVRGIFRMGESGPEVVATQVPELYRSDQERLSKALATIPPGDLPLLASWADWASNRAEAFADSDLAKRAAKLQREVIDLERQKPASRSPEGLLALAKKARAKGIAEPIPSSFIHLALRLRLGAADTVPEFEAVARDAEALLPASRKPFEGPVPPPSEAYKADPEGEYRKADEATRAAMSRRLWTDAWAGAFRLRAAKAEPSALIALSDEARTRLPDRPEIAGDLRRRYYEASFDNVEKLPESSMRDLARSLRDDLKQPEKAATLTRNWLENRRQHGLIANDADQRVDLAGKYLSYLKDKATAADLLRDALRIDPGSRDAEELFQRMGYVHANGEWRDPKDATAAGASTPGDGDGTPGRDDPLLGLTPAEVKAQLGEPKSASRVVTQARVSLQWIYESGQGTQYIDFVQRAGDPSPVVVGRYSIR